jgi:hypothetical protein
MGPTVSDVTNDKSFLGDDKGIPLKICRGEEAADHLTGSFPEVAISFPDLMAYTPETIDGDS